MNMEHMDQTIPFVVLAVVGLLLLFLLRRASPKENVVAASLAPVPKHGAAVKDAKPIVTPIVTATAAIPVPITKPRKKRAVKPTSAPIPEPTPIETALGLLQQKDTLGAAFLLREIFDAPVSLR